jgi:L-glutamine-phosphate cytidylyltransferase
MKAIILAAGRGSRMLELTNDLPKCLVPLAGKPLLAWQLKALNEAGVKEIGIVKGYLAEKININVTKTFINQNWNETNIVRTLVEAENWLQSDNCIVSYSDIVYPANTVQRLLNAEGDIVITYDTQWDKLWRARFQDPLSDAESFRISDEGVLIDIGSSIKNINDIEGQYMGLLRFTPVGWDKVSEYLKGVSDQLLDKMDMTTLLKGLISKGVKIIGVPIQGDWCEVDHLKDREIYEKELAQGYSELVNSHLKFLKS